MIDLISEIGQKSKLLDAAVQELGKRGRSYAQSEQEYRIALAKRILDERSKGTPVTIISDICRGDREIAKLRFERDCAEVVYKSALEAINAMKLQLRMLDAQVEREWGHAGRDEGNIYSSGSQESRVHPGQWLLCAVRLSIW